MVRRTATSMVRRTDDQGQHGHYGYYPSYSGVRFGFSVGYPVYLPQPYYGYRPIMIPYPGHPPVVIR